jgi:hypothetical protein
MTPLKSSLVALPTNVLAALLDSWIELSEPLPPAVEEAASTTTTEAWL